MENETEEAPIQIVTVELTTEKTRTFNDPKSHGWGVQFVYDSNGNQHDMTVVGYTVTTDEGHGVERIFYPKGQVVSISTRQVPR